MRGFGMIVFAAAFAAATPVAAADLATLGCVRDGMSAPVRAEIVASAEALVDGKTATASPELRAGLEAAAKACAVRYSWSNAAREAAQTYGVVSATLDTVRPLAAKNDVRLDVFTRALQSLTSAQRTQILNQEKAGTDALVAALAIQGMPVIGEKQGSSIGVLAVLTLFEESQKARFIAS